MFYVHLHFLEERGHLIVPFFHGWFFDSGRYRRIKRMGQVEVRVRELVDEKISDRGDLFIVDIKMHSNGKLVILVDGDEGISIQDCVAISRHVGFHLEEENVIDSAYNLEVSSPGTDFPLVTERQYRKNIGRKLKVKLNDGHDIEGKLLEVSSQYIKLETITKEKGKKAVTLTSEIPFENIATSKVLISFK